MLSAESSPGMGIKDRDRNLSLPEVVVIYLSNLWGRMSLKLAILVGVCLQNAGYTLIRKYSTLTEQVSSKEILLVAEVMKVAVGTSLPSSWVFVSLATVCLPCLNPLTPPSPPSPHPISPLARQPPTSH